MPNITKQSAIQNESILTTEYQLDDDKEVFCFWTKRGKKLIELSFS